MCRRYDVNSRDREIQRLGDLFAGGRPAAALAKDCCYRGVDGLGNDVATLQQDKLSLQQKLNEEQELHERTTRKLTRLSEKNKKLEQELAEIEHVALKVESAANADILERDRKCSDLEVKLQHSQLRIRELESVVALCTKTQDLSDSSSASSSSGLSVEALQTALKQATQEKLLMHKRLIEVTDRERALLANVEKVKTKYSNLKQKYVELELELQTQQQQTTGISNAETKLKIESLQYRCSDLTSKLRHMKEERDRYSSEADRQRSVVEQLKQEGIAKEHKLAELKSELHAERKLQRPTTVSSHVGGRLPTADSIGSGQSSLSVKAAIHRIERERDVAKSEVRELKQERDALREKLQLSTRSQQDELAKHEQILVGYSQQIAELEAENRDLQGGKSGSQMKMKMLKEENHSLQSRVKELEQNYSKLKLSNSQLRILQDQTERALALHQNRLLCTETQLGTAENKLHQVDSTVDEAQKEIEMLKGEIRSLTAANAELLRLKDKLLMDLDKKTECLYTIEAELKSSKTKKKELQCTIDQVQQKLE
uniref:Uncharacterized protein n=1 Tax=Anopheles dirus TaxID=7168 RepID=A0A182N300_9DIPT